MQLQRRFSRAAPLRLGHAQPGLAHIAAAAAGGAFIGRAPLTAIFATGVQCARVVVVAIAWHAVLVGATHEQAHSGNVAATVNLANTFTDIAAGWQAHAGAKFGTGGLDQARIGQLAFFIGVAGEQATEGRHAGFRCARIGIVAHNRSAAAHANFTLVIRGALAVVIAGEGIVDVAAADGFGARIGGAYVIVIATDGAARTATAGAFVVFSTLVYVIADNRIVSVSALSRARIARPVRGAQVAVFTGLGALTDAGAGVANISQGALIVVIAGVGVVWRRRASPAQLVASVVGARLGVVAHLGCTGIASASGAEVTERTGISVGTRRRIAEICA